MCVCVCVFNMVLGSRCRQRMGLPWIPVGLSSSSYLWACPPLPPPPPIDYVCKINFSRAHARAHPHMHARQLAARLHESNTPPSELRQKGYPEHIVDMVKRLIATKGASAK